MSNLSIKVDDKPDIDVLFVPRNTGPASHTCNLSYETDDKSGARAVCHMRERTRITCIYMSYQTEDAHETCPMT